MDELILARHGLAGSNRDGVASCTVPGEGLVPEGVEQARVLRALLAQERIALAVTSELARTQETLALALEGRDVVVVVVPELNEIDFGSFDGGPLDTYRSWAAAQTPNERAPDGGESRADAAARFARGLRAVLTRDEDKALLVGHALMLRYTLDAAEGQVPAARMAPVAHAHPHRLVRADVERAAALLESWSLAPAFRV
jgi:broad specificity phosphatase PhoE